MNDAPLSAMCNRCELPAGDRHEPPLQLLLHSQLMRRPEAPSAHSDDEMEHANDHENHLEGCQRATSRRNDATKYRRGALSATLVTRAAPATMGAKPAQLFLLPQR